LKIDKRNLEHFIKPEQAAELLGIDIDSTFNFIKQGKLRAAVMPDGKIGISQESVNQLLPKEALPEYKENVDLKGKPISINEAGRKYKLNTSTITRWMQRGLIRRLGTEGRKTLLDEADVAYCSTVYSKNKGQGKWAFDDSGRPYPK
jgi:predicted site-specific integrase-resolvase